MTNRTDQDKTYLILFISFFLTFAILYFAAQHLIINEFVLLENRQNSKNINKLIEKTSNTLLDLKKMVTDYAHWNDTYEFIIDHNSAYIESNFPEDGETLDNLGIDFFLMADLNKKHIFIHTYNRQKEVAQRIYEQKVKALITARGKNFSGLIKAEGGFWFIVVEPILHSDETGPKIGYLLGAKELNMDFVHLASQELFEKVIFEEPIQKKSKNSLIKNAAEIKVQHYLIQEEEKQVNKLLFYDLEDHQIFTLCLQNARTIYLQGKETTQYFILFIFFLSIPLIYLYMKYQELLKDSLKRQLANEIEKNQNKDHLIKIKERLNQAQHIAHIGNFEFDLCKHNAWVSDEVYNILKANRNTPISTLREYVRLIHPEDRRLFFNTLRKSIFEHLNFNFSYRLHHTDGNIRIVQQIGNIVYDKPEQTPLKVLGTLQDITEKRQYEDMIHSLAYYDLLTRLPNRTLFKERLQKALSRAIRIKSKLAVM